MKGRKEMSTTYRIDIDGTIAEPKFYHENLRTCCDWYVNKEIVKLEEVESLQVHQQLFLIPHVLVTHVPIVGSVEVLQALFSEGKTFQYFTVRQALRPEICVQVHQNTHVWLEQYHFPLPGSVHFFWDAGKKLTESLQAKEDQILLIDDRPDGLVKAYQKIATQDPDMAQQIKQRVTVLAFGSADVGLLPSSDLKVIPLPNWFVFHTAHFE
jgi:hypothetical protein